MKFRYARYNGKTLRPVIPIKVKNGIKEIGYQVLVDSGADLCLFDAQIGEFLGVDVKSLARLAIIFRALVLPVAFLPTRRLTWESGRLSRTHSLDSPSRSEYLIDISRMQDIFDS